MPEEVKLTHHEQQFVMLVTIASGISGVLKEILSYLERTEPSDTLRRELAPAVDCLALFDRSLEPLRRALGRLALGGEIPDLEMFLEPPDDSGTPAT
ncbi:MAG: hypothetical protein F4121_09890 [Acidimicrobiia bacterium]|nr:hypothetical protein [Acidimicrobiia bacterium]MYC43965.1 hypothetical protein [Acidimicrobiia bacterium]MYI20356.1 hypothetical protein [Acidimicrobiia bacterium]